MENRIDADCDSNHVNEASVKEPPPQPSKAVEDAKASPRKRATKKAQWKRKKMPAVAKNDISRESTRLTNRSQVQTTTVEHAGKSEASSKIQPTAEGYQPETPLIGGLLTPELSDIEPDSFCYCCQHDMDNKGEQYS